MNLEIRQALRKAKRALREPRLKALRFDVPLIPPSVNHYKRPKACGKGFYVTEEAKAFKAAVASLSKGSVEADQYFVSVVIYFGPGQRGDVGNLEKCIGDGLQDAGIMSNDSKVKKYAIEIAPERSGPRTEIFVCDLKDLGRRLPEESNLQLMERMCVENGVRVIKSQMVPPGVLIGCGPQPGLCRRHGALFCRQCGTA